MYEWNATTLGFFRIFRRVLVFHYFLGILGGVGTLLVIPPFLEQPPILPTPPFLWENFESSTLRSFIKGGEVKGGCSNYDMLVPKLCIINKYQRNKYFPGAVVRRYFSKYLLFKIMQYSQENTCVGVSF